MSDRLTGDVHAAVARGLEGVDLRARPDVLGRIRHAAARPNLQGETRPRRSPALGDARSSISRKRA